MTDEMIMAALSDIDKLDETYSFRLPEVTKKQIEKLSPDFRKKLCMKLLLTTAEILHESNFNPRAYLSTRD